MGDLDFGGAELEANPFIANAIRGEEVGGGSRL